MTIYEFLSHLLVFVAVLALGGMAYFARALFLHYSSDASLDDVMDEWESWAEAEHDRRAEARMCPGYATSPLNYYGLRVLVERRLFIIKHDLVWDLNNLRERGLRVVLRMKARNLVEYLVANNIRRYMNGRMGYGWTTENYLHPTDPRGMGITARFPRLTRVFDRVQEFIFT